MDSFSELFGERQMASCKQQFHVGKLSVTRKLLR